MQKLFYLIIFIAFYSCNSGSHKVERSSAELETKEFKDSLVQEKKETYKSDPLKDTSYFHQTFNIDDIKEVTSNFSYKVQVEDTVGRKRMPKHFLENYISKKNIVIGYPDFLTSYYPESYSFQNFKEYKNFILFTFSHFDESCCINLYAATSKKDSIDIINIGLIGYTGADGGWIGEKYSVWENDSTLAAITTSEYDEDLIEENNNTEMDTIWSVIKFDEQGYISEKVTNSVHYIGSKKNR